MINPQLIPELIDDLYKWELYNYYLLFEGNELNELGSIFFDFFWKEWTIIEGCLIIGIRISIFKTEEWII